MIYAAIATNFVLLLLSNLHTWRPITFRALGLVQVYYTKYILMAVAAVVSYKYVRRNGQLPDNEELKRLIWGKSIPQMVVTDYTMNAAAFVLYIVITITVKLLW